MMRENREIFILIFLLGCLCLLICVTCPAAWVAQRLTALPGAPTAPSPTSDNLRPTHVQELPDGSVIFAHQPCEQTEMAPGVYGIAKNGTGLRRLAPLPYVSCHDIFPAFGDILWSPDGEMFLYLSQDQPLLLGRVDGSVLWDVREMLAGGRQFQWQPATPYVSARERSDRGDVWSTTPGEFHWKDLPLGALVQADFPMEQYKRKTTGRWL